MRLKNRRRLKPAPYSRAVQAREEVAHASWSCVKAATPRPRATLSVVTRRRHDRDASVRSGLGDFSGGEQPWHAPVYESIRFDSIRGKRLRRTKTRLAFWLVVRLCTAARSVCGASVAQGSPLVRIKCKRLETRETETTPATDTATPLRLQGCK